jgi:hypothetical protein
LIDLYALSRLVQLLADTLQIVFAVDETVNRNGLRCS